MRTKIILTIISIANLVAGALFVGAVWMSSMSLALCLVCAGLALVTSATATTWGVLKIQRGLNTLRRQSGTPDQTPAISQIVEFDDVGRRFAELMREARQSSSAEVNELADVNKLLDTIDRRGGDGNFNRDGESLKCAARLRSILKGYGGDLDSHVRQTISCGREIRRATEEIVSGSETQSDAVSQTTSCIERLSSQIISISDNAEEALEASTKARDTAVSGLQEFQKIVEEIKKIRNHAAARERKLQALGQHTKEIESIVQTIGSLSSRTDLLALNASIESVRAGEHGRGFAVVADEVRALAEQSAQAVLDITRRIEMIQLETHQSISVASGEHDQMHQVIKRVTETLESLQEISEATSQSSLGLTEISVATNQQLALTQEVISALELSTQTAKKNRSRAEGAIWTAKTLAQVSTQLDDSLELFRLTGVLSRADVDSEKSQSSSHTFENAPATV